MPAQVLTNDFHEYLVKKLRIDQFARLLADADVEEEVTDPKEPLPGRGPRWRFELIRGKFPGKKFVVQWRNGAYWLVGRIAWNAHVVRRRSQEKQHD